MRKTVGLTLALTLVLGSTIGASAASAAAANSLTLQEFKPSKDALCALRDRWTDQVLAKYPAGTWAPLRMELGNEELSLMGLPSKKVLLSRSYSTPTLVTKGGAFHQVALPAAATYAGLGCFGIRPGAWVLMISGGSIGWCSLAHVYGAPGSYDISTAGHCGRVGQVATVIAAFGNRPGAEGAVLLNFGKFIKSTNGGVGNDWAMIDIYPQFQSLVSPTMCFWGGPRGKYTKIGALARVTFPNNGLIPSVSATADPLLAQGIAHYGHGTGIGAGGTPRAGAAIHWGTAHFMFNGVLTPGDSGSGSNTVGGDTVGATMEAAGINTHIYVDPLMRSGIGIMAGTRVTRVTGTMANGQLVPYPVPVPGAP